MRVLITGGAGFVGAALARSFRRDGFDVVVFDNLRRRGSELNLARLRAHGIHFVHGDVRAPSDLDELRGTFDLVVEASAEPSVHAGSDGSTQYIVHTNLLGAVNCLDFVRHRGGALVFLSTSRVYSIAPLRSLSLTEEDERYELDVDQPVAGATGVGISEEFPTHLPRSLYGATKLAAEQIIQEYVESFGVRAVVDRCGVIAGPGQFGKVDQGVFTLWVARHHFGRPLRYTGFGGEGKQVRDLLHPEDLYRLVAAQFADIDRCSGEMYNVGGGREISTSLRELTALAARVTGRGVPISKEPETNPLDIPLYLTDSRQARERFDWRPLRGVTDIVEEIHAWLRDNEAELAALFDAPPRPADN